MSEKLLLKNNIKYYFSIHKKKLILLYLVTILSNLINLIPLYLFGSSVDFIISGDFKLVLKNVFMMVTIFIITTILSIIETMLNKYIVELITIDIKKNIYQKVLKLKRKNFNELDNGQILSRIENDSSLIANFITSDLVEIFISVITLIITLAISIKISLYLSGISILTFPISMVLSIILSKKTKNLISRGKKLQETNSLLIQETLNGLQEFKCLRLEDYLTKKFLDNLNLFMKNNIKTSLSTTGINVITSFVSSAGEWIIILVSALMIINGTLTIGTLVSFNSFCSKFTISIRELSEINVKIQSMYLAVKRIYGILSLPDENEFISNNKPEIHGTISIENIDFSYNCSMKIIDKLSLSIKPNNLYVIVGKNGCGKSTLLNLLLRFYESDFGKIKFDDNDIKDINIYYLRSQICYIPQQPYIFQGTLLENLSVFKENISLKTIEKVCTLVGLNSFIKKLPNGYNTVVGKNGINLSGGQRQKLAIARGILLNPKIMILDEITSDLDSQSELEIMKLLNDLTNKFTIITVAHRISSILLCPNIIVMRKGKVISQGTHNELINNCEEYIDLYKEQLSQIVDEIEL